MRTILAGATLALLALPGMAHAACSVTWDGGGADRRWQTAANWPGDAVPGPTAEVCIPALTGTAPVIADGTIVVASLTTQHPVRVTGTLTATLLSGSVTLADGAELLNATIDGADVAAARGAEATMRGGELRSGTLGGPGDLTHEAPGLLWTGGDLGGDGVSLVAAGATFTMNGTGSPSAPDLEFPANFALTGSRTLANFGTITWPTGRLSAEGSSVLANAGTLAVTAAPFGATGWQVPPRGPGDRPLLNTGTVVVQGPGDVRLPPMDNDGTLQIDRALVRIYEYLMSPSATLRVGLAGTVPGDSHGQLSVGWRAWLQGRLELARDPGFTPPTATALTVLSTFERSGQFDTLAGTAISPAVSFVPSYDTTDVVITATPTSPTMRLAPPTVAPVLDLPGTATRRELRAQPDVVLAASRSGAVRRSAQSGLLANDVYPPGTRIEVVSTSRRAHVAVDLATGAFRVRARRGGPRVVRLRYRLVAADGRRSDAAAVRIVFAR